MPNLITQMRQRERRVSTDASWHWQRVGLACVLILALLVRASFIYTWHDPYGIHHSDEVFLPYEAVAMWEGVTPRELGWPGSTTRLLLSAAYALAMVLEQPARFLSTEGGPFAVVNAIATWSRARLDDPRILNVIGRWSSVLIGVLQVWLAYWAVSRWSNKTTGVVAAFLCAITPIAVSHSQYILADIAGVFFLTCLLGLLAPTGPASIWRALGIGALVGLATASKYHFAVWLIAGVVGVWQSTRAVPASRSTTIHRVSSALVVSAAVLLLLVPWIVLNPVLVMKEFAGVVLDKVGVPGTIGPAAAVRNILNAASVFGWLVNVALLPGLLLLGLKHGRRSLPVYIAMALGTLAIASSDRLYGRYSLMVLPAVALMSATAVVEVMRRTRGLARAGVASGMVILVVVSGQQLWASQRLAGTLDTYSRAYAWIMTNMRPGDSIAVDSDFPQHLPRTKQDLERILMEVNSPQAYIKKMTRNDVQMTSRAEPMRLAILNDELYVAHWARRELEGDTSKGFNVTFYADRPQYNSILTTEAAAQFVHGLSDPAAGFDVLVLNRAMQLPVAPALVLPGNPGRTMYLYLRRQVTSSEAISQ